MLDLKEEPCSVSESQSSSNEMMKRCADCQTTTTPLWRGGPAGPKTLCNACGIKYHKRRRALLGLHKAAKVDKSKRKNSNGSRSPTNSSGSSSSSSSNGGSPYPRIPPLKLQVMASGMTHSAAEHLREKLGEVEQAAMLLMALSYGSVYA